MPLPSAWNGIINMTGNSRKNIFQAIVKRMEGPGGCPYFYIIRTGGLQLNEQLFRGIKLLPNRGKFKRDFVSQHLRQHEADLHGP